jgi:zinc/manganese transport system substrate-binding protein
LIALATFVATACGSESGAQSSAGEDVPTIVVTTNILGDVVRETVGDLGQVEVIMPLGSDPHDFAPSAQQAEAMENADLLVVNGAGFEEGMLDLIEGVEDSGVRVFAFADHVDLLDAGEAGDEHEGEAHSEDEHGDEEGGGDPHIWTDPSRMATAVDALGLELAGIDGIDAEALTPQVDAYVAQLTTLDSEIEDSLNVVPEDQRVLVTNHEVFRYFADRFGFELVGAVVPSLTTNAESSASEIEALAALIELEGIPAIFAETTQSTQLADAIAESVGSDVLVVELFTESLGEPGSGAETYITMMSTNGGLVADALS